MSSIPAMLYPITTAYCITNMQMLSIILHWKLSSRCPHKEWKYPMTMAMTTLASFSMMAIFQSPPLSSGPTTVGSTTPLKLGSEEEGRDLEPAIISTSKANSTDSIQQQLTHLGIRWDLISESLNSLWANSAIFKSAAPIQLTPNMRDTILSLSGSNSKD